MQLSIIIPTLNEHENIGRLLKQIARTQDKASLISRSSGSSKSSKSSYEMIVVDDGSTDGTREEVLRLMKKDRRIRLVERSRKCLSGAIMEGASRAKGEMVLVMDADLQHDPTLIPEMVGLLRTNDLVVATRNKLHGAGLKGKMLRTRSMVAASLVRIILGAKLKDPLSGFFAFRKELMRKAKPELRPIGFKFLLDIYIKARPKRVAEVSYSFGKRRHGKSKQSLWVALAFLHQLAHLAGLRTISFLKHN